METESTETRQDQGRTPLPSREVVVTDVEMRFGSMVKFMVKWTIASIPAFIILVVLFWILWTTFLGLIGS